MTYIRSPTNSRCIEVPREPFQCRIIQRDSIAGFLDGNFGAHDFMNCKFTSKCQKTPDNLRRGYYDRAPQTPVDAILKYIWGYFSTKGSAFWQFAPVCPFAVHCPVIELTRRQMYLSRRHDFASFKCPSIWLQKQCHHCGNASLKCERENWKYCHVDHRSSWSRLRYVRECLQVHLLCIYSNSSTGTCTVQ